MKYSSQIHLPLYHRCVLAYWCPSLCRFPEGYTVAFCLVLPSSHQPALSNHLANYAFKPNSMLKEIIPLYTVNQLMKVEKTTEQQNLHVKSSRVIVQSSEPESLMKEKAHLVLGGKYWREKKKVRSNLLITGELFHIQMVLLLRSEDGCGRLILLAFWAVASLWRPRSHLCYQIMLSDWSLFGTEGRNDNPDNADQSPQCCTLISDNKTW